jgi:F0F1-type ATP synthase delta subunit
MLDGKMSDITVNLMTALAGNARLQQTAAVVDAYSTLMKASRGKSKERERKEKEMKIVMDDERSKR